MSSRIALLIPLAIALLQPACSKPPPSPADATELRVSVGAGGYAPEVLRAPPGKPVRVIFTRTTDDGCGQQLVFPAQNIRRDLPLDKPVAIDLTMPDSGSLAFTCGMAMYKGSIVLQ